MSANPNRLRILPAPGTYAASPIERIAVAMERIADRFDSDAAEFSEMVKSGKGLSVKPESTIVIPS
jgi:hypothetical protein